jgi:hypothetical protein
LIDTLDKGLARDRKTEAQVLAMLAQWAKEDEAADEDE